MSIDTVRSLLLGLAVGDALGVPYESSSRHTLERNPVEDLVDDASFHYKKGTWSDDSALSFCLAEMLTGPWDLTRLADCFIEWKENGYWSATGTAFSVGKGTSLAIERLKSLRKTPIEAGLRRERDNGNGSLMRILPLVFAVQDRSPGKREQMVTEVSSLTHAHRRAILACNFCVELALAILKGASIHRAYEQTRLAFGERHGEEAEAVHLARILDGSLASCSSRDITSTAYVIDTLESALWSLLATDNYRAACLAAVNLGGDTDSVTSIVGGLAGLAYGVESIPDTWLEALARRSDIEDLACRLAAALGYSD